MARRRFVRRASRRSKDLVWITTIIEASFAEATSLDFAQVVVSSDWSGGNVGFDRCTLMAVRGWLGIAQVASATATEATGFWSALYVTDGSVALNSMDPDNAVEYSQFDVLYTTGVALAASGSPVWPTIQFDVRARRKLTTASEIRFAGTLPTDTGTPRVTLSGCTRALLRLDPAS